MEAHMNPNKKEMEKMHQQYCRKFLNKEQVGGGWWVGGWVGGRCEPGPEPELRHRFKQLQIAHAPLGSSPLRPTTDPPPNQLRPTPGPTQTNPHHHHPPPLQREMSMSCVLWEERRKMMKKGGPLDL